MNKIIPAINFHLWKPCNFRCKFCFATYEDEQNLYNEKSHLSKVEMMAIIDEIAKQEITKITFAGGEPLLCKWLSELIGHSKTVGLTTMIVTNGFLLTDVWLEKQGNNLDWVTLSIDTIDYEKQLKIGRSNKKKAITEIEYKNKVKAIKNNSIRFKLNTVVCSVNIKDDLSEFVKEISPERWKIFQVLPIAGQNDDHINDLVVSESDFLEFVERHKKVGDFGIEVVTENNDLMTGSYLMIDPQGRLYDNVNGTYRYSEPILKVGFEEAYNQINIINDRFYERNGLYNWQ